ncbi:MAG: hypothetical protein AB7G75_20125 [Candidatus Binatia bacterium]
MAVWADRAKVLNRIDHILLAKVREWDKVMDVNKTFRGELVPQDPNDEPASVLLEGIRANGVVQTTKTKRNQQRSFPGWGKEAV